MGMTKFDSKTYFPMELEKKPIQRQTRLDSDLQSFWEDYALCDLQGKTPQELKLSIEEHKLKKHWLDLEQARDEERVE
jgi:hypothetical protein